MVSEINEAAYQIISNEYFLEKFPHDLAFSTYRCLKPTNLNQITVGYALIAVINGVFLKETFSAAENDDKIMMRHLVQIQLVQVVGKGIHLSG